MNFKMILTLTTLTSVLLACGKTSSGTSAASASSTLTISPMSNTVAPGGTTTVMITGGTGVYVSVTASQGKLTQASSNSYLYTAPASSISGSDLISATDSAGTNVVFAIMISGSASSSSTAGASPFTNTSCQGAFTLNVNGAPAALNVVQNVSNQISGYLLINSYYFPISGSCSVLTGQTSGSMSFTNLMNGQAYGATLTSSGGRLVLQGSVPTGAATYTFTGYSNGVTNAPVVAVNSLDGTFTATIGANLGQLRLIDNGTGTVGGYLLLQGNYYAFSGTGGGSVSFRNLTNGSVYSGTATFNGTSVAMSGNFTTSLGATLGWSANK